MILPRCFWVPPVICGLLAAGCLSGLAWNGHIFADFPGDTHFCNDASQDASGQDAADPESPHESEKSQTSDQMERVAEIMRASTEGTIQMLSDLFKN